MIREEILIWVRNILLEQNQSILQTFKDMTKVCHEFGKGKNQNPFEKKERKKASSRTWCELYYSTHYTKFERHMRILNDFYRQMKSMQHAHAGSSIIIAGTITQSWVSARSLISYPLSNNHGEWSISNRFHATWEWCDDCEESVVCGLTGRHLIFLICQYEAISTDIGVIILATLNPFHFYIYLGCW